MSEKIRIADLPEFGITEHLEDDQVIAEYLTIVLEEDAPALLAAAMGDIARARHDRDHQPRLSCAGRQAGDTTKRATQPSGRHNQAGDTTKRATQPILDAPTLHAGAGMISRIGRHP